MFLCVKRKRITRTGVIIKDHEGLTPFREYSLLYNAEYYNNHDKYIPLSFLIGFRTLYSNKVLSYIDQSSNMERVHYVEVFPHSLNDNNMSFEDLVYYMTSLGVLVVLNNDALPSHKELSEFMLRNSVPQFIGAYVVPDMSKACLVSHVIFNDDVPTKFFKDHVFLENISDLGCQNHRTDSLYEVPELLKQYVLCKEADSNA